MAAISGFSVPAILEIVQRWLEPFRDTELAHPHWQRSADNASVAIGMLVLLIALAFTVLRGRPSALIGSLSLVLSLLFLVACLGFHRYLDTMELGKATILAVTWWWMLAYIGMKTALIFGIGMLVPSLVR